MHHGEDRVDAERLAHGRQICDVALDEGPALHRFAVARDQVVVHHHPVAGAAERLGRVAADVACAAGHQHARRQRPMEKYVKPSARICSGE